MEQQREYYEKHFFPYLEENNITTILHLGDLFDKRKQINFTSLSHTKECFITPIIERKMKLHLIVGNHDSYYKSSGDLVSSKLLFDYVPEEYLEIYDKPVVKDIGGQTFHIVPWIFPSEREETLEGIRLSAADICVGHFEMIGIMFQGSTVSRKGIDPDLFKSFRHTFSGHYHKPSQFYVGSPYQMTWSDYEDRKRIIIYDTVTDDVQDAYIGEEIYHKIEYDGVERKEDLLGLRDKIVRVVVKNKDNPNLFDKFIEALEELEPHSIDIKEEYLYVDIIADEEEGREKSTLSILMDSIDDIGELSDGDKIVIKEIMKQLYEKAIKK